MVGGLVRLPVQEGVRRGTRDRVRGLLAGAGLGAVNAERAEFEAQPAHPETGCITDHYTTKARE